MKNEFIGQLTFPGLILLILIFIVLSGFFNQAEAQDYPFDDTKWIVKNVENNQEVEKQVTIQDESQVLHLPKSCIALLNQNFSDFTIEYDVKGGAMPGLGFRSGNLNDYEYFYLRMMNSGKNTAIQYIPVFNGAEAWTLYNYPKYESFAAFPDSAWIHVKLQVYGTNMRVFINNQQEPNMEVKLQHEKLLKGNIFLKSGFQESLFRNVKINELNESFDVDKNEISSTYIDTWKLSDQFEADFYSQNKISELYNEQSTNANWKTIKADKDGLVNISRFYEHPQNAVFAISEIYSDSAKTVGLLFDYSFSLLIGLNYDILFCGTELDTKNYMRVIDGEEKLTLPLNKGKNVLIFIIKSDDVWQKSVKNPTYLGRMQAHNWGFIARLANYEGLDLEE
jgi:hypothetical protein